MRISKRFSRKKMKIFLKCTIIAWDAFKNKLSETNKKLIEVKKSLDNREKLGTKQCNVEISKQKT